MKQKKMHLLTLFFLVQWGVLAQQTHPFAYGGASGKKFNGSFLVSYYIHNGERFHSLEDTTSVIDLNLYKNGASLVARIEKLQLGLNRDHTKLKHSDHPKVFYLEVLNTSKADDLVIDTLKLGSKDSHYGQRVVHSFLPLSNLTAQQKISFTSATRIVDGVYNRKWNGPTLQKSFVLLPKTTLSPTVKTAVKKNKTANSVLGKKGRKTTVDTQIGIDGPDRIPVDSLEYNLWVEIQKDRVNNDTESLKKRCKLYMMNCELEVFKNCVRMEDVLFFALTLSKNTEKERLRGDYLTRYPQGKYTFYAKSRQEAQNKEKAAPIVKGLARIDHDEEVLLINRVQGGETPYFLKLYDLQKNKNVPVKILRFNKPDIMVTTKSLGIPEGNYKIRVTDARNRLFIEKEEVFIAKATHIPKSLELGIMLGGVGFFGFLYKKFVHF